MKHVVDLVAVATSVHLGVEARRAPRRTHRFHWAVQGFRQSTAMFVDPSAPSVMLGYQRLARYQSAVV